MNKVENEIKSEVKKYQDLEAELLVLQNNLSKNKEFKQFLKLQKAVNDKADEVWSDVETKMIENGLIGKDHAIDAEWVKLTIVEKPKVEIIGPIAAKFMKRVPDTAKINKWIKDNDEVPEGVVKSTTKYLRKTFRSAVS